MTGNKRKYLVTGNWNENADAHFVKEFTMNVLAKLRVKKNEGDVIVAPPFQFNKMLAQELDDYEHLDTVGVCAEDFSS